MKLCIIIFIFISTKVFSEDAFEFKVSEDSEVHQNISEVKESKIRIIKAYKDIGINAHIVERPSIRGLKELIVGKVDADIFRATSVIDKEKLIAIKPYLFETEICAYSFKKKKYKELKNSKVVFNRGILALDYIKFGESIKLKGTERAIELYKKRNKEIDYFIGISTVSKQIMKKHNFKLKCIHKLKKFKVFHVISKKHESKQAAIAESFGHYFPLNLKK